MYHCVTEALFHCKTMGLKEGQLQIFKSQSVGRLAAIAGKVGVDQLVYSPICMMVFFTWVNVACLTPAKAPQEISQKLIPSITMSWLLWTPAMVVNMALVPANLRMLYINVVSLVRHQIIMSCVLLFYFQMYDNFMTSHELHCPPHRLLLHAGVDKYSLPHLVRLHSK